MGAAFTSDNYFAPTSTGYFDIKISDGGKVGLMVTYLPASSLGSIRLNVQYPSSTDGAWGYGVGGGVAKGSTTLKRATNDFNASSSEYSQTFFGPFETARYGCLSTITALANHRVIKVLFDACTTDSATQYLNLSSNSTTIATVATTIHVMAFEMP